MRNVPRSKNFEKDRNTKFLPIKWTGQIKYYICWIFALQVVFLTFFNVVSAVLCYLSNVKLVVPRRL